MPVAVLNRGRRARSGERRPAPARSDAAALRWSSCSGLWGKRCASDGESSGEVHGVPRWPEMDRDERRRPREVRPRCASCVGEEGERELVREHHLVKENSGVELLGAEGDRKGALVGGGGGAGRRRRDSSQIPDDLGRRSEARQGGKLGHELAHAMAKKGRRIGPPRRRATRGSTERPSRRRRRFLL